jgi:hypothetical protein
MNEESRPAQAAFRRTARPDDSGAGGATNWLAEAAVDLARRGFRVHPLRKCSKVPLLERWTELATSDPVMVAAWWRGSPASNVGIATGHGLIVLDVDYKRGGYESLFLLEEHHGSLPRTLVAATGARGLHIYLATSREVRSVDSFAPGIELKASGKQVVAPPSIHPASGAGYSWKDADAPIAEAPAWVLERAAPRISSPVPTPDSAGSTPYGRSALWREAGTVRTAAKGGRNNALNLAAFRCGQLVAAGHLTQAEVEQSLSAAALEAGLSRAEILGSAHRIGTLASGLNAGMGCPRGS